MDTNTETQAPEAVEANTVLAANTYHFRTVDPATGKKRESLTVELPLLTVTGLIEVIKEGGKGLELLLDVANAAIIEQGKEVLAAADFNTDSLTAEALSWATIAAIPKADRVGNGIAKEVWEAFSKDYIEVMPTATGITIEQATKAAKIFVAKLQPVKSNKDVLAKLLDRLNTWFASTEKAEDFLAVYETLTQKINTMLTADDSSLLENI